MRAGILAMLASLALAGCTEQEADVDWPLHGRTEQAQRFTPLDQIDTGNVGKLGLVWFHDLGTDWGQEATPIMVGGVLYLVSAYDRATGRLRWRCYTVPGEPGKADGAASDKAMAMASRSWSGQWWRSGGGGTVWDAIEYEPQLNLVYIGTGNGSPWSHVTRSQGKGDSLFLSSIVALVATTGDYVRHFQTAPAAMPRDAVSAEQGDLLYGRFCLRCHGSGAVSAGAYPDLPLSSVVMSEAFRQIVLDGALASQGMPGFAGKLTGGYVEAIRTYLAKRSFEDFANKGVSR
jgi:mono/diheme cytochrome c family protein